MIWIPVIFLLIYIIGVFRLLLLNRKYLRLSPKVVGDQLKHDFFITVIIAVRNEEKNIAFLLDSICKQEVDYEIIIVNDHSDDKTVYEVEQFVKSNQSEHIKLLHLKEITKSPKKSAISLAIQEAKGDIIVTTDGDCIVPKEWLKGILESFQDSETKMVLGGVRYAPTQNVFEEIQGYELSALLTISMTMAHYNRPFTCNGANLAYRKNVFHEVNGFEGIDMIASGDDELLMKKIVSRYPLGVAVQAGQFVDTLPNVTFKEFFYQRIRWASKWKYGSWQEKLPGLFLMVLYLSFLLIIVPSPNTTANTIGEITLIVFLVIKFIVDSVVIILDFGQKMKTNDFNFLIALLLFVIYPFYVILFGFSATFLKFSWKGRKLK